MLPSQRLKAESSATPVTAQVARSGTGAGAYRPREIGNGVVGAVDRHMEAVVRTTVLRGHGI